MNPFTKLVFLLKKPRLIIVTGKGRDLAAKAIFSVLKAHFDVKIIEELNLKTILKNRMLILVPDFKDDLSFFIKNLKKPILVITHIGEIPPDVYFFAGEEVDVREITKLAECLQVQASLILNFDDETIREIGDKSQAHSVTFGFQKKAELQASDFHANRVSTNFKMNHRGNIIPVWLENLFGKENVYAALTAACCGIQLGLNLVEISQALKNFKGLDGKMKLIKGIKDSRILDDSESASPFSMAQALKILGEIESEGRRIAVLGDILGIERYSIEAHESIGGMVTKVADLLLTVGPRAKFFAQGAERKKLPKEKIFYFDTCKEVIKALKKEIKKGDLILIDGSKEMKMGEVVKGIKAI